MFLQLIAAIVPALLISISVHAELYKKVDEQGNITYSDVPSGAAKPVQPPGLTTYGTPSQHKQSSSKAPVPTKPPATLNYTTLAIASPVNDEALRENSGTVAVSIKLEPPLDTQAGHKLVLVLDQKSAMTSQTVETALKDVERGLHNLKVQVADANGRVLKESAPINFQLHRGPGVARKAGP